MSITWADVVLIAPNLAALTGTGTDAAILADVALMLDPVALGSKFDLASKWLAAHFGTLAMRGSDGAGGAVASETVGALSRSYQTPPFTDPLYETTAAGKTFIAILSSTPLALGTVA